MPEYNDCAKDKCVGLGQGVKGYHKCAAQVACGKQNIARKRAKEVKRDKARAKINRFMADNAPVAPVAPVAPRVDNLPAHIIAMIRTMGVDLSKLDKIPPKVKDEYDTVKEHQKDDDTILRVLPWTKETEKDSHGITWKVCNFTGKKEYIYWDKNNNRVWSKKGKKMQVFLNAGLGSKSKFEDVLVIEEIDPYYRYEGKDDRVEKFVELQRHEVDGRGGYGHQSQQANIRDKALKRPGGVMLWEEGEGPSGREFWSAVSISGIGSDDEYPDSEEEYDNDMYDASPGYNEYLVTSRRIFGDVFADSIASGVARQWKPGDPIYKG